jgi:hypothetical protein
MKLILVDSISQFFKKRYPLFFKMFRDFCLMPAARKKTGVAAFCRTPAQTDRIQD